MAETPDSMTRDLRPADGATTREFGDAARLVSWLFLVGYLLLSGMARGVYSSHEVTPSSRFEVLSVLGFTTFLWYWVKNECGPRGATFPIDFAWFMLLFGLVVAPYYLWRYQRWRGLAKFGILLIAHAVAYFVSLAVHYALVWTS